MMNEGWKELLMSKGTVNTFPAPTENVEKRGKKRVREEGKEERGKYTHGEYDGYYNYRVSQQGDDPRLGLLEKSWFTGAKVKDIGCNSGKLTMALARCFQPRYILGVDLDATLIKDARSRIDRAAKEYAHILKTTRTRIDKDTSEIFDPLPYPLNVSFEVEDFTASPASDVDISLDHSFDIICAFSVTKWIHLCHGDEGLLRFFRRVLNSLKPGGRFIVEPQDWRSYKRARTKNRQSATIAHHIATIQLRPKDFPTILTSSDVGFDSVQFLGRPDDDNLPAGFRRPIYCAHKKNKEKSTVVESSRIVQSAIPLSYSPPPVHHK